MDIRQVSPRYSVSPQINPEDVVAIKAAGFTKLICNRPDSEVPPTHKAAAIAAAAEAAGLTFVNIPLTHDTMNAGNLAAQRGELDSADGTVLAYCATGTRCTVAWSLTHVADMSVDELISSAADAGYDLAALRPRLEAMANDNT